MRGIGPDRREAVEGFGCSAVTFGGEQDEVCLHFEQEVVTGEGLGVGAGEAADDALNRVRRRQPVVFAEPVDDIGLPVAPSLTFPPCKASGTRTLICEVGGSRYGVTT